MPRQQKQQLVKSHKNIAKHKIIAKQEPQIKSNIIAKPKKKINRLSDSHSIIGKSWNQIQVQIRPQILQSVIKNQFTTMFPVQEAAIPLLLKNYDLAVEAQTGSGKTLSFLIPLLQKYLSLNDPWKHKDNQDIQSKIKIKYLLISPTRQLCQQSYNTLVKLLNQLPNKERSEVYKKYCHCVTGGSQLSEDIERIQGGVYVLMGTIGRLRQISLSMQQNWLKNVDYLFIDEADRVLKEKGIQQLIRSIQKLRRTAMFSATLQGMQPKHFQFFGMRNLAKISLKTIDSKQSTNGQNNIEKAKGYVIPKSLHNTYIVMNNRLDKIVFLINFLQQNLSKSKIIVFLSTCACVDYYTKLFETYFKDKHNILGIHGKLKTRRRKRIIQQFFSKQNGLLFATDVVSRGIDFQYVQFIIQVDPPEDPDNYIHRIGRTARVNRPGTAILLIEEHEESFINYLGDKGVGVQKVKFTKFIKSKQLSDKLIQQRFYEMIITDRDYVQKGKKAFVSYVRAYKQHQLRYIFQFKNVNIGKIASSFFLLKIPRIKEILGIKTQFQNKDIQIQQIPWLDKNQQAQFSAKEQYRQEMRKQRENKKEIVDIKNIKSRRKKVKRANQEKQRQMMNKQHRQILKKRKLHNRDDDSDESQDYNEDTQQLQQRVNKKMAK